MKNIVAKITFSFLILTTVFAVAVENSVIPLMEKFECIENLPSQKFTKQQFSEISNALEKKEEVIRLVTYNMLFNLYDHCYGKYDSFDPSLNCESQSESIERCDKLQHTKKLSEDY